MNVDRPDHGPPQMSNEMRDLYVWLDERLQQIALSQVEAHLRLRSDMEKGFGEMRGKFDDVFKQAWAISERTTTIESERRMERRAGMKAGAIYGAVAGAAMAAIVDALLRGLGS